MSRQTWVERERALLRRLLRAARERAAREADRVGRRQAAAAEIEARYAGAEQSARADFGRLLGQLAAAEGERQARRREAVEGCAAAQQKRRDEAEAAARLAQEAFDRAAAAALERARRNAQAALACEAHKAAVRSAYEEEVAQAHARHADDRADLDREDEALRRDAEEAHRQTLARLDDLRGRFASLQEQHAALRGVPGAGAGGAPAREAADNGNETYGDALALLKQARRAHEQVRAWAGAYFLTGLVAGLAALVAGVLCLHAWKSPERDRWAALGVAAALAAAAGGAVGLLRRRLNRWSGEVGGCRLGAGRVLDAIGERSGRELRQLLAGRGAAREKALARLGREFEETLNSLHARCAEETRQAEVDRDRKVHPVSEPAAGAHAGRLAEIAARLAQRLREAEEERDAALAAAEAGCAARSDPLWVEVRARCGAAGAGPGDHEEDRRQLVLHQERGRAEREEKKRAELAGVAGRDADEEQASRAAWCAEWQELRQEAAALADEVRGFFPDWPDRPGAGVQAPAPAGVSPALRLGELAVRPDGAEEALVLPALAPFPDRCSLLWTAGGAAHDQAVAHARAVVLRILTSLPAGKARFTFLDPAALGEHFAPFLHLADHDERLVGGRVWTEPRQIEQQLEALAEHMTHVIQKYLRGQFADIAAYNARAGDVAEPYRFLVVAGFPAGFTPEAVRRLQTIVAAGPRCGINTLLVVDPAVEPPAGLDLDGLRRHFACFDFRGGEFVWQDDDFGPWPLRLDSPPEAGRVAALLHEVGGRAKEGGVVRVPFALVAPPPESWWAGDSRSELRVPLGRAGATRLQELRLGRGVAQHVLVAGKTGSGKSTLLHTLIVNLALHYGPQEVQLYLVDFKKGVEFKPYAALELPHARVVAVESEREFGLSVLQRLDAEMQARGERFRQAGVPNLESYRNADPAATLPRLLLLVDEFQEFFVEDDRVARDATLLLDRLVRQGRAFGMHVVLASQSLAGAWTLARATVGQMAVRIALQCTDADGRLVLGEDNGGARLLSRPGQAVYNDANGAEASNDVFQTAWLGDEEREEWLGRLRQLAAGRKTPALNPVVFEGNVLPEVGLNRPLGELLARPAGGVVRGARVWLGEPVAIAGPVSAAFERQSGTNLASVGAGEDMALGAAVCAAVALAAQHGAAARVYLVNGLLFEESHQPLLDLAGRLVSRLAGRRDAADVVAEVGGEVDRRIAADDGAGPPVYLLLVGVEHLRDLRRAEDDFGPARGSGYMLPSRVLAHVLREGPGLGVHTLAWADTLAALQRCLERHGLREFALRVAFQMSAADSAALIDSPLAGRLGPYAALLYNEQRGRLDKFRPYGLPGRRWLAAAVGRLAGGA
jgi:energy-coupling factor transporter ATP-binding protein EcfA2